MAQHVAYLCQVNDFQLLIFSILNFKYFHVLFSNRQPFLTINFIKLSDMYNQNATASDDLDDEILDEGEELVEDVQDDDSDDVFDVTDDDLP